MVIHPRRDHSLRIPRPDLSMKTGSPNACNLCHADKKAQWAVDAIAKWYGPGRRQEPDYGDAIWAGRTRQPGAAAGLVALARVGSAPNIVRATALELLRSYPGQTAGAALKDALSHSDPMIRRAALEGLQMLPAGERSALASPLLNDRVRAVRIEAARLLAPVAPQAIGPERVAAFNAALAEYEAAQRENADRPEGHLNLGALYASLQKTDQAQAEYRKAIELNPMFVPAYVNLADLQRATGTEPDAEQTLREGLRLVPASAPLHHALGLSLVRQRRAKAALAQFAHAAKQAPEDPRYTYVYGVALHDFGKAQESASVLEAALARYPGDRDLLAALASYARDRGDTQAAARYAERLRQVEGR